MNQREFKLLMRDGRLSMMIGLLFLTTCLSGAQLASTRHIPGAPVVEASLTIAGWVAMWHPMDIYLYGWWPLRRTGKSFASSALCRWCDILISVEPEVTDSYQLSTLYFRVAIREGTERH